MNKINILDEITANKIAAGEVVERPASVVKELVENALDAGSTVIKVEIEEGGSKLIRVTDNGSGIYTNDVPLAFQRHATSKLTDASDLHLIQTLGFRGEALPSIAAVAKMNMYSRAEEEIAGTYIEIHGGKKMVLQEAGCPTGTSITVNDLFFNTPARKKHMKSLNVEAGHVSDIIGRLAMANPRVSFILLHNGRTVLQSPGTGNTIDAIASIYGVETARNLIKVSYRDEMTELEGFLARPMISRSNRNHQSLYINKRYIKSRLISDAIEEGYHTLLNIGRHPLVVLNFTMNPELVDVNVHPTKMEVRFSQSEQIAALITTVVKETLLGDRLIPEISVPEKKKIKPVQYNQEKLEIVNEPILKESMKDLYKPEFEDTISEPTNIPVTNEKLPYMEPIGQIDATYIVAQGESGMYLIDQHAAHERILYENFMQRDTELVSQDLLVPITLELTHLETQMLVNNILVFTDLGFQIEHFGGDTFLIRAVPQLIPGQNEKKLFLDLLDTLSGARNTITPNEVKERIIITMACKAAIKANHRLSTIEMEELINRLQHTANPYTCPHGRPTVIYMSGYELEKKFKRVL